MVEYDKIYNDDLIVMSVHEYYLINTRVIKGNFSVELQITFFSENTKLYKILNNF